MAEERHWDGHPSRPMDMKSHFVTFARRLLLDIQFLFRFCRFCGGHGRYGMSNGCNYQTCSFSYRGRIMQTMSSSDESVEPIPELNHNPEDDATKEEMSTENIESDDLTADKIIPDDSPDFLRIKYDEVRKVCDEQVSKLKDRNFRQQAAHRFRSSLLTILRSVFRNVQEGEWGQRGEEWFAGQAALVAFIVFGVHPVLHTLLLLAGGVSLLIGGYFVASSLGTLGENTTPFVAPVKNSKLRDYGVYRLVRHPMYGGLILLCAGLAVVTQSLDKAVLTMALTWLLDKKSDLEEQLLIKRHGKDYIMYMSDKRKFIPFLF